MTAADQTKSLGARIKALLKARGMSQSALAAKAGVDRAEINRLINDRRQPRLEELGWIAEALRVGIEQLIGDLELPAELRRALGHFGDIARRILRAEGEREEARAQVAALGEELTRERQERRREREALERKVKQLTGEVSRLSRARLQAKKLASRNQVLSNEVRKLRGLATGCHSKSASDLAATILTIGVLGKSILPTGRQ
jgi:transcriptional regulator with XRE-family HTH domain